MDTDKAIEFLKVYNTSRQNCENCSADDYGNKALLIYIQNNHKVDFGFACKAKTLCNIVKDHSVYKPSEYKTTVERSYLISLLADEPALDDDFVARCREFLELSQKNNDEHSKYEFTHLVIAHIFWSEIVKKAIHSDIPKMLRKFVNSTDHSDVKTEAIFLLSITAPNLIDQRSIDELRMNQSVYGFLEERSVDMLAHHTGLGVASMLNLKATKHKNNWYQALGLVVVFLCLYINVH